MNRGSTRRWASLFLGIAFLLAASGCGLGDYEAQMSYEQARLEHLDRENRFLEGPIKWPEKKDEKKDKDAEVITPAEVFFRPPKGMSTTPQPAGGALLRLAPGANSQGPIQEIQIAVVRGKARGNFRNDMVKTLGLGGTPSLKRLNPPGRSPTPFEHYHAEPGLDLFLFQDDYYQAAILFRSAKPDTALLELSLGTLLLGNNAVTEHYRYSLRRPTTGK